MLKRKRTKLENFFNVNRYKKRQGAKAIMQEDENVDFDELKNSIIAGSPSSRFESPMIKDLQEHINHLKKDFQGQSELLYYHAKLIVLSAERQILLVILRSLPIYGRQKVIFY